MTIDPSSRQQDDFSVVDWSEEQLRGDDVVSAAALTQYGFSEQVTHRMITLSENATYLVDDPGTGRSGILRVHRENYHTKEAIESELDWLAALGRNTDMSTSTMIPTSDGERVVTINHRGIDRYAVMFEVMPGIEPDATVIRSTSFETLGTITAQLHQHARSWQPPASFCRFSWDWKHTLGDEPRWGTWAHDDVPESDLEDFRAAVELMRNKLESFGTGPERYGLIHADLRLANLLIEGDQVNVIDFDDSGFGWFLYDFGAAVSFMEDDERIPELQEAWLRGYRTVTDISAEEEAMLPTFVLFRRFLLTAWLGSHGHSQEMQELGASFSDGTRKLVHAYLASDGASIH